MPCKPISDRYPPVTVEYDRHSNRVSRTFENPWEARHFYTAKFKADKHPRVKALSHGQ